METVTIPADEYKRLLIQEEHAAQIKRMYDTQKMFEWETILANIFGSKKEDADA